MDVCSVKWADPVVADKKLPAALGIQQKQPEAPREANPATGYGVSHHASLLREQALAQGGGSCNLNSF